MFFYTFIKKHKNVLHLNCQLLRRYGELTCRA